MITSAIYILSLAPEDDVSESTCVGLPPFYEPIRGRHQQGIDILKKMLPSLLSAKSYTGEYLLLF